MGDASDILRKIQSQTRYNYLVNNLMSTQPKANISSCSADGGGTVKINYTDFAQRNDLALGKYYVNGCSTTTISYIVNSQKLS